MSNLVTLNGYRVGGTPNAMLFSLLPKSDPKNQCVWLPRSQIERVLKQVRPAETGEWEPVQIEIPEWLAEKKGLV